VSAKNSLYQNTVTIIMIYIIELFRANLRRITSC